MGRHWPSSWGSRQVGKSCCSRPMRARGSPARLIWSSFSRPIESSGGGREQPLRRYVAFPTVELESLGRGQEQLLAVQCPGLGIGCLPCGSRSQITVMRPSTCMLVSAALRPALVKELAMLVNEPIRRACAAHASGHGSLSSGATKLVRVTSSVAI